MVFPTTSGLREALQVLVDGLPTKESSDPSLSYMTELVHTFPGGSDAFIDQVLGRIDPEFVKLASQGEEQRRITPER